MIITRPYISTCSFLFLLREKSPNLGSFIKQFIDHPFHAWEYNGTQELPMNETIRNPCSCRVYVLEGLTQTDTPSTSYILCSQ